MFKDDKGGAFFELFNATNDKCPIKISANSGVKTATDNEIKSKILILEGRPTTTRIQLPKDAKHAQMGLSHSFLVLQIFVFAESDFSFELYLSDSENTRRKVIFSTSTLEINTTSQLIDAKVPLNIVKRDEWLNLCVDLSSFVAQLWRGKTYRCLDSITVTASCKLTKIFTMRDEPADTSNDTELYKLPKTSRSNTTCSIPRKLQLPNHMPCSTQVLNMSKLCLIEWTKRPAGGQLSNAAQASASNHYSMRVGSGGSGDNSSRENSSKGSVRLNYRTESSASSSTESVRHPGPPLCPHPPSGPSSGDLRRRRIRVKSQQGAAMPGLTDSTSTSPCAATAVRETRSAGMASDVTSDLSVQSNSSKSQSAGKSGPRALKNERRIAKLAKSGSTEASDLYYFRSPPRATSRESNHRSESIPASHSRNVMQKSASVHCIQRGTSSNTISPPAPRKDDKDCGPIMKSREKSHSSQKTDQECSVSHSISVNRKSLREISPAELNKKGHQPIFQPQPSALTPSPRQPTIRGGPSKQKRTNAKAPLMMVSIPAETDSTSNATSNKNVQTSPQPYEGDTVLNLREYQRSDNLSESFEARLLAYMTQSGDGIIISNTSTRCSIPLSTTNQIAGSYCDDEEDTITNTITGSNPAHIMPAFCSGKNGPNPCLGCLKGENCLIERKNGYLEEMHGAWPSTMRSSQEEVSISLPLDPSIHPNAETDRILSPPILLDRGDQRNNLASNRSKASTGIHSRPNDSPVSNACEDQLQLLYDPILNCYYDPITYKYYELV